MTSRFNLKSLHQLGSELDRHFRSDGKAGSALEAWLRLQFHPVQVYALVKEVMGSPDLLREISARSYRHGNGFLKIALLDRGYKLRLHVWFPGSACEENIHDHRWGFSSTILVGGLVSEIYRDAEPGEKALELQEYTYHAARTGGDSHKTAAGVARLRRISTRCQPTGSAYTLQESTLHRIINPGNSLVATLMCTAPTQQGHTRLITSTADVDPEVLPPRLSADSLAEALEGFLDLYFQQQPVQRLGTLQAF